jgi:hypothetical protein
MMEKRLTSALEIRWNGKKISLREIRLVKVQSQTDERSENQE